MAKQTAAAAAETATPRLSQTFPLSRPIAHKGQTWSEITLAEPHLSHFIVAERQPTNTEFSISLVVQLSGIPEEAVRKMKLVDLRAVQKWVSHLRATGGALVSHDEATGHAVFALVVPIPTNTAPIETIRLREPDLESSVAVEAFKKQHEQTAAMIAALADLTIPVVSRLSLRDLAVIEAWLAPFVDDTKSREAPGAT